MTRPDALAPDPPSSPTVFSPAAPGAACGAHATSHTSSPAGVHGDRGWWEQLDALVGLALDTDPPAGQRPT